MLEMFSFIFGGIFRLAPKLIEMRERRLDREHEEKMFDLQLKADELRSKLELQKLEKHSELQQQLSEIQAMIAATKAQARPFEKTGNKWLDALLVLAEVASSMVRPILTYWYCVVAYGAYKVSLFVMLSQHGMEWPNIMTQIWTANDHAVMFSIIGFWFVDRAIRKREQGS